MAGSSPDDPSTEDGGARRRAVVLLVLGALLVLATVGWWFRGDSGSDVRTVRFDGEIAAGESAPVSVSAPAPQAPVGVNEQELPAAVRDYLERTVYPPDSGRLDAAGDALEANARHERFKPVPGSQGSDPDIEFLWTANAYRFSSDETVEARFEARQGDAPVEIHALEAWAQAEGRSGTVGGSVPLALRPRGGARVGDLDLATHFAEHHGFVVLGVRYAVADVVQQEERIRIFVTPTRAIPAEFTGNFRAEVRGGNLEIEAGIDVFEPGFYRVDAHLYGPHDAPIAWAAYKGELGRSDGTVPLKFFGKILRDLGSEGPYEVRQLRGYLFRDGEFPDRIHLRDYAGSFRAPQFALSEFSEAEWDDPHRRRMVELMLQDHAAGIALDTPPPPADAPGRSTP